MFTVQQINIKNEKMNIFELKNKSAKKPLPKEGTVNYYGKLLSQNEKWLGMVKNHLK